MQGKWRRDFYLLDKSQIREEKVRWTALRQVDRINNKNHLNGLSSVF